MCECRDAGQRLKALLLHNDIGYAGEGPRGYVVRCKSVRRLLSLNRTVLSTSRAFMSTPIVSTRSAGGRSAVCWLSLARLTTKSRCHWVLAESRAVSASWTAGPLRCAASAPGGVALGHQHVAQGVIRGGAPNSFVDSDWATW